MYFLNRILKDEIQISSPSLYDQGRRGLLDKSIKRYFDIFVDGATYLMEMGYTTMTMKESKQLKIESCELFTNEKLEFNLRWENLMDSCN